MKKILINATHPEETRVAVMEDGLLIDLDVQINSSKSNRANIYKGKVARVEPSLEACFVEYSDERHGFLPLKEIIPTYLRHPGANKPIGEQIEVGQEIVVQVEKPIRDKKGAALTTYISLAGRYLVMLLEGNGNQGVSKRISREHRQEARDHLRQLGTPEGFGLIMRTDGVGKSLDELQWDLNHLQTTWERVTVAAEQNAAPCLILSEADILLRTVRDYLVHDVEAMVIDNPEVYEHLLKLLARYDPEQRKLLHQHTSTTPLFSFYKVEEQIARAFSHKVRLPSGGSMVIDQTEALVAIDINSSKSTKSGNIEDTAFNTNMEAAREVARQLRIRDIGGLVVIDFIDMSRHHNQRAVRKELVDSLAFDRARVQVGEITRFGLLEMSRQRIGQSLSETTTMTCPRCRGIGKVRNSEYMAMVIMRLFNDLATREKTMQLNATLPVPVAAFLLNDKRADILQLEQDYDISIIVVPTPSMHTPFFEVNCTNIDGSSFVLRDEESLSADSEVVKVGKKTARGQAANKAALISDNTPTAPIKRSGGGFLSWLRSLFGSSPGSSSPAATAAARGAQVAAGNSGISAQRGAKGQAHPGGEDRNKQRGQHRGNRHPAARSRSRGNRPEGFGRGQQPERSQSFAPKPQRLSEDGDANIASPPTKSPTTPPPAPQHPDSGRAQAGGVKPTQHRSVDRDGKENQRSPKPSASGVDHGGGAPTPVTTQTGTTVVNHRSPRPERPTPDSQLQQDVPTSKVDTTNAPEAAARPPRFTQRVANDPRLSSGG